MKTDLFAENNPRSFFAGELLSRNRNMKAVNMVTSLLTSTPKLVQLINYDQNPEKINKKSGGSRDSRRQFSFLALYHVTDSFSAL